MIKYLFFVLLLIPLASVKAQTFTSGHIHVTATDSMSHDSTTCMVWHFPNYHITIDSSYTGETLSVVDTLYGTLVGYSPYVNTTGASPWSFDMGIGASGLDDYQAFTGHPGFVVFDGYVMKITCGTDTLRYIVTHDTIYVSNPCEYDTVQGHVYIDNNINCIRDSVDGQIGRAHV